MKITAISHPNIAFIKYWGNRDNTLRLPANGSISMNLGALETRTTVETNSEIRSDSLTINGQEVHGSALERVIAFINILREMSGKKAFSRIISENNFPQSAGVASSAAAFSALALAGSKAYSLDLSEKALSILARRGSGSASRSIPGGFVEWYKGGTNDDSFAKTIASADHWQLWDCVAILTSEAKKTGSTEGHTYANTSPFQATRIRGAANRLKICREAILKKDFDALAEIIELDSNMMHAVMMTSRPALMYWSPKSLEIMQKVSQWRNQGISAAYTLDAGPNVHVICTNESAPIIKKQLEEIPDIQQVLSSCVGPGAALLA